MNGTICEVEEVHIPEGSYGPYHICMVEARSKHMWWVWERGTVVGTVEQKSDGRILAKREMGDILSTDAQFVRTIDQAICFVVTGQQIYPTRRVRSF